MDHVATEPFLDLVDESLDEAAFLWQRWERELTSPTRNLDEIWSWTEDRLHGALDGVRAGGPAALDILVKGLQSDHLDTITVCTGVLASSSDRRALEGLEAALGAAESEKLSAIVRGLELLGSDHALRSAASLLGARGGAHAGALCRLKAFRRVAPGEEVRTAFESTVPAVLVDGIRSARHLPLRDAERWIATALDSGDPLVRTAAVESGIRLGMDHAWHTATHLARRLDSAAAPYLTILALLGTAEDHETVYAALPVPELQLPAIWALGHIGTVRAVEACLAGMQHEKLARASGEAYCWITGADLERDHLAAEEPASEVPPFEQDDLDLNLVPPPEALWPLPDRDATRRHWSSTRRSSFVADTRYVHSQPVTTETRVAMVETGPMLRRPDLVFELGARTRGRYDVETRAFTHRQHQMMAKGRAALSGHDGR